MRIEQLTVKDFKALKDASFSPGYVNILIGANGAGKSTLLEAIGVLSAAITDRVDGNALLRKGVRLSAPSLYKSAFKDARRAPTISMGLQWSANDTPDIYEYCVHLNTPTEDNAWRYHSESLHMNGVGIDGRSGHSKNNYDSYRGILSTNKETLTPIRSTLETFRNYAIYQPFTAALRGIVPDPQQAVPIGLNGGRLAEALEEIIHEIDGDYFLGDDFSIYFDEVLDLIDWADSISIGSPSKERINSAIPVSRRVLEFQDRYLYERTRFSAYDASEGALYVLFLYCLILHPRAPGVFAVDNFDQAMHPRLARAVTRNICNLVTRQKKTVFLTTHNPLVLDGLDLSNDSIRLFTLNRSPKTGYISIQRICVSEELTASRQSLSQLWTSGRIGGTPDLL